MRQIRIYVDAPLVIGANVTLPSQAGEHVARVLRMVSGDALRVFNGDGHDYAAVLTDVGKRQVDVRIEHVAVVSNESPLHLTLAQGVARGEKMDLILQKATELGVTRIVPLLTERAEVRLDAARTQRRLSHWQAVIASACEQSGRARLPAIDTPIALQDWLSSLGELAYARLALLPEANQGLRELHLPDHAALLVVGPEGGLGERDVAALQSAGFQGLRLGPRILRTETAGLAAIAALQALLGDFG